MTPALRTALLELRAYFAFISWADKREEARAALDAVLAAEPVEPAPDYDKHAEAVRAITAVRKMLHWHTGPTAPEPYRGDHWVNEIDELDWALKCLGAPVPEDTQPPAAPPPAEAARTENVGSANSPIRYLTDEDADDLNDARELQRKYGPAEAAPSPGNLDALVREWQEATRLIRCAADPTLDMLREQSRATHALLAYPVADRPTPGPMPEKTP